LLRPGELIDIRRRLRNIAPGHDVATVIACAFDHRTRMLPFTYAGMRMVPAGVRAIGSAMIDVGFEKTRIVLQQWNKRFRPSRMRLDGRVPDIFMISSMQIHTTPCKALIRDACRIDPSQRPLIIVGGAKVIYEPWDVFSVDPDDPWAADVAVTGEEYVLLNLLEVVLSTRAKGESLRSAFIRARDGRALDAIPGLVYVSEVAGGVAAELVDTGVQRLVGDLDELPDPAPGYGILEAPSRRQTLAATPLATRRVRGYSPLASLVLTFGCKFACPYCPIPAYNQRQHRVKSGGRIGEEMSRLRTEYGIRYFFGADDNFFNDPARTIDIAETLAAMTCEGVPLRKKVRWGTEVTVHDTLKMKDHLRVVRKAGVRALWLGVEDMTGTLVKKGQSPDKTIEAFRVLEERGIGATPMMMHHDSQPLLTFGGDYGLLNQVRILRKAGAIDLQVLMITPATGSKSYEDAFESGMFYDSVGGRRVEPHMLDANYIVASASDKPWRKQFNIMATYVYFYNPLRLLKGVLLPKKGLYGLDIISQVIGMWGLAKTIRRTLGWGLRLMWGKIVPRTQPPHSLVPMRSPDGGQADHALPGTPTPELGKFQPEREQVPSR